MLFVVLIIGSVLSGCMTKIPTEPVDYSLYEQSFRRLTGLQTLGYDQIQLFSAEKVTMNDSIIQAVYLGQGTGPRFRAWDSTRVTYSIDQDKQIRPHFQITHSLDSQYFPTPDISVRYRFKDGAFIDIDTTAALYTYPYSSAEVFCPCERIFQGADQNWVGSRVQDFLFLGNNLLVHPYGPLGIGKLDRSSGNSLN